MPATESQSAPNSSTEPKSDDADFGAEEPKSQDPTETPDAKSDKENQHEGKESEGVSEAEPKEGGEGEKEKEGEEEEEPNYTRLGYKGAEGDLIKWLEIVGVLPNPGKTEIGTGIVVDKILGSKYGTNFGTTSEFVFDVKYLLKKWLSQIPGIQPVLGPVLSILLGADVCKGETKIIVGPEVKLTYGNDLKVLHGHSFEAEYPGNQLSVPTKNAGMIIVTVQKFLMVFLVVMGFLDLAITLSIKILMMVSGKGDKAESYKRPIAMIELISALLLPKLQGLLITAEKDGAEAQMALEAAESALESAEHFFEFALMRCLSPGLNGRITREVAESERVRVSAEIESAAQLLAEVV